MTQSNFKTSYFNAAGKLAVVSMVLFAVFFSCKNKEEKPDDTMIEETTEEDMVMTPTLEKGC